MSGPHVLQDRDGKYLMRQGYSRTRKIGEARVFGSKGHAELAARRRPVGEWCPIAVTLELKASGVAAVRGLPVAGYRDQTGETVSLVNLNKELEEQTLRAFDELAKHPGVDQRWLAIGRSQLEQGFMAANRAIFKPGRVALPGER